MAAPIRIQDSNGWIVIEPQAGDPSETYPVLARFGRESLGGAWHMDLFDPPGFADELERLHSTLQGEAVLADNDGFSVAMTIDGAGHIRASVHIDGPWSFGVEGWIEFTIDLDQTYLPDLWRAVREALPPMPGAQRRIGEAFQ